MDPIPSINITSPVVQYGNQIVQFLTFQTPLTWILLIFVFNALLIIVEIPRSENLIVLFRNLTIWDFVIGLIMWTLQNVGLIHLPITFILNYISLVGLALAITLIISSLQ
jgi:uncharacterized membrane protein